MAAEYRGDEGEEFVPQETEGEDEGGEQGGGGGGGEGGEAEEGAGEGVVLHLDRDLSRPDATSARRPGNVRRIP